MPRHTSRVLWLSLSLLLCSLPSVAQSPQPPVAPGAESGRPDAQAKGAPPVEHAPDQRLSGRITGTIVDPTGAPVSGASVKLSHEDQSPDQEALANDDGQFSLANVAPGSFHLTITSAGFAPQSSSGILQSGESHTVPQIALVLATAVTEVRVVLSRTEVAEDQIKVQEKQRVLGVVPNFYVSYDHHAVPLTSKQKFELAWKTTVDPVSLGVTGAIAGIQQAQNDFSGYGQGAQGYAKRLGAAYGDFVAGTYIGGAILPSLLKQDPRYFYKGSGSKRSRILYALCHFCDFQGRQRALAGKLLWDPRKLGRRRYLKSLLPRQKSRRSGVNFRKRADRDWRICRRQSPSGICHPQADAESC